MKSIFSLLLTIQACVAMAEEPAPPAITLPVGTSITIHLPNNPTTGYSWDIKNTDLKIVKVETSTQKPDEKLMGAPSPLTVTITGLKEGTTTLTMTYQRPWEKDKAPEIKLNLPISVK